MATLMESVAIRSGSYTEAPVPTEWINVSRKLALQAKRCTAEKGMMDVITSSAIGACGVKYGLSNLARSRFVRGLRELWV